MYNHVIIEWCNHYTINYKHKLRLVENISLGNIAIIGKFCYIFIPCGHQIFNRKKTNNNE